MIESSFNSNKRIAKNTIILYLKLITNIVVGLITSRFVLQALGESDYGLYNVVAGVLTMISFVSASMSETSARYINFEIGKTSGNVNKIFNTCQVIHLVLALFILLLAETVGIYYVKNILTVANGMEGTAMFVYQISTISACFGIINAPYQGLIIAKEKFITIAKIEISNSILKLIFVLMLFLFHSNVLIIYSIFMAFLTIFLFASYHWICFKRWPAIVKWDTKGIKKYYKGILSFNNYNVLATASQMVKNQGSNLIINYFYGTVVNAAYGIAFVLQNYLSAFMGTAGAAAAPQITQNISSGTSDRAFEIACKIGRVCLLMSIIVVFPILSEVSLVLKLWLGHYPALTVDFVKLILILTLVGASSSGVTQTINGLGKIKWYKIIFSILCFSSIPLSIISFHHNLSPTIVIKYFIGIELVNRSIQLILLKKLNNFDSLCFIREAYLRPIIIIFVLLIFIKCIHLYTSNSEFVALFNLFITVLLSIILCFYIGLTKSERKKTTSIIVKRFRKVE